MMKAVWKRAQKELEAATRVSFVGLSMHPFLDPTFKFLLNGVDLTQTSFAVVNSGIKDPQLRLPEHAQAHTPEGRTIAILGSIRQSWNGANRPSEGLAISGSNSPGAGELRLIRSFADFILEEL